MKVPIYSEYEQCQGCTRCIGRRDLVPSPGGPRGPGLRFWVVVGEAAKIDMQNGVILESGPRAKIIDGILSAADLAPNRVYRGAVNRCMMPIDNEGPDENAVHCGSWTKLDALYHRPLVVVAFGERAQSHFIFNPSNHRCNLVMCTRADYRWRNPILERVEAKRKVSITSTIEDDRSHPLVIKAPCIDTIIRRKTNPDMRKEIQKLVSTLKAVVSLSSSLHQIWTEGDRK